MPGHDTCYGVKCIGQELQYDINPATISLIESFMCLVVLCTGAAAGPMLYRITQTVETWT